jgi:pimeloyl-ACP methyl ester carboxylesterase
MGSVVGDSERAERLWSAKLPIGIVSFVKGSVVNGAPVAEYGAVVRATWADETVREWHPVDGSRVFTVPDSIVRPPSGSTPLMLLHGVGNNGAIYAPLMPSLAELGPVFAPTMSPSLLAPLEHRKETVGQLVDWLSELAPPPWRIVGHSMGGVLTGLVLRTHPEVVTSAVLLNSPLPGTVGRIQTGATLDRAGRALLALKGLARISSLGRPRLPGLLRGAEMAVVRTALRGFMVDPGALDDQVISRAIIASRTTDGIDFLKLAELLPDWALDPHTEHPIEIIVGDQDPLIEAEDHDEVLGAYPQAVVHVAPECGHFVHLERPHFTLDRIQRFFSDTHT